MKVVIISLLVVLGSAVYNQTISKRLLVASAATYASDQEISAWNCKVCEMFPLVKVILFLCRLLLLPITFLIFTDSRVIHSNRTLLLLHLKDKQISRIGLPT